jgi:hypothetical protein
MPSDRTEAISALLVRAEEAHGAYEAAELNGVYDQDWPRWYAAWAVEHGLGALVGRDVSPDEVEQFLARSSAELEQADPKPTESWAAYTAARMAADL